MIPGVSTQIFGPTPLDREHISMVKQSGFDNVELYGVLPHFDIFDMNQVHKIERIFRELDIKVTAVHAPYMEAPVKKTYGKSLSLSLGNKVRRNRALASIRAAVDAAAFLGSDLVVVHFGVFGDRPRGDVLSNIISSLINIEEYIRNTGIRIAFENIGTPLSVSGYMMYLLDKYDFQSMGICLDIAHANLNEDPPFAIEYCKERLFHVHISDNHGAVDEHLYPFEGTVKWNDVIGALRKIGYSGCLNFEPRNEQEPLESLKRCRSIFDLFMEMPLEENNENDD